MALPRQGARKHLSSPQQGTCDKCDALADTALQAHKRVPQRVRLRLTWVAWGWLRNLA